MAETPKNRGIKFWVLSVLEFILIFVVSIWTIFGVFMIFSFWRIGEPDSNHIPLVFLPVIVVYFVVLKLEKIRKNS